MTAPLILLSRSGSAGPYRVQMNVLDEFEQIRIGVKQKGLVSALEDVSGPGLRVIDPFCVTEGNILHDP